MIAFLSLRQTFKCKVHLRAAYNSQFFSQRAYHWLSFVVIAVQILQFLLKLLS